MPTRESVERYIAALNAGNADAASRIFAEALAGFEPRMTDGGEIDIEPPHITPDR